MLILIGARVIVYCMRSVGGRARTKLVLINSARKVIKNGKQFWDSNMETILQTLLVDRSLLIACQADTSISYSILLICGWVVSTTLILIIALFTLRTA